MDATSDDGMPSGPGVGVSGLVGAAALGEAGLPEFVHASLGACNGRGATLLVLDLPRLALVVVPQPGRRTVRLAVVGRLDAATGPLLDQALAAATRDRPAVLVVDLRRTAGMDDAAGAALAASAAAMSSWNGVLTAWRPPPAVRGTLLRLGHRDLIVPFDDAPVRLG